MSRDYSVHFNFLKNHGHSASFLHCLINFWCSKLTLTLSFFDCFVFDETIVTISGYDFHFVFPLKSDFFFQVMLFDY